MVNISSSERCRRVRRTARARWILGSDNGSLIRSISSGYDGVGDAIAMGDMTNNGAEEIVVANAGPGEDGRVDVSNAFGFEISHFTTSYDATADALAVGDITNDNADEVVVANAGPGENGRVDIHNLFGFTVSSFGTDYDASGDKVAVGDVTGDGADEIVVANDEGGGRMDVVNLFGHTVASFGNTGYDADDTFAVGDVTGDGRAEIVCGEQRGQRPGRRLRQHRCTVVPLGNGCGQSQSDGREPRRHQHRPRRDRSHPHPRTALVPGNGHPTDARLHPVRDEDQAGADHLHARACRSPGRRDRRGQPQRESARRNRRRQRLSADDSGNPAPPSAPRGRRAVARLCR